MQVRLKGLVYNYTSDFDPVNIQGNVNLRNWKVSAGDYFKFPVRIGRIDCFIKRFAKPSKEISGYNFLIAIKDKKLPGLPEVYDVVHVTEAGKEVIYLFTEFLPGDTLFNLQMKGFSFSPVKLASDLFLALQSIHTNGYWFPDFDPKNLYRLNTGDFYIIDLDSTYPLSVLPSGGMHGSKDYWSPVHDYYRKYSGFTNADIKAIKGNVFNDLNLIYLCGLYSSFLFGPAEDLTAYSIVHLNDYLQQRHKLFSSTMVYCCRKDNQGKIIQRSLTLDILHNLIKAVLFPDITEVTISNLPKTPEISKFTINGMSADSCQITPGESVVLEWTTKNASHVTLLPGKRSLETSGKLELTPDADIKYTLQAEYRHKKGSPKVTQPFKINIDESDWKRPVINFFVQGKERNYYNCPVDSIYKLNWTVYDADKVYLDNIEVPHTSYKEITLTRDTKHTLRAENIKRGKSKSNIKVICLLTENKPAIQFSVSPKQITPGESVHLSWNVTSGKNIMIMLNGDIIAKNYSQSGSMNVKPGFIESKHSPKEHTFSLQAETTSGNYHFNEVQVVTLKQSSRVGVVIAILIGISVIIYFLIRFYNGYVSF